LSGVKAIAAGDYYSLALKEDGTIVAWGNNSYGQLGDGTTNERNTPVQVQNLGGVKVISAGRAHSLALKEDGTVVAWGYNQFGQLGDGTTTQRNTPVQVKGYPPTNEPVSSSSAASFTWDTWDNNLSGVKAISAGEYHSLAVKEDGTVFAWGYNSYGQLGDGTTTFYRTTLVQVQNLSGVKAVAAGANHSLALKEDGTVQAWGHNEYGQLGNNRGHPHETDDYETERRTPVQVIGLDDVEAISASGDHSLAKVVKPPVIEPQ
jgi:alpha-tubulin suppressor-like RCC1 family protein